jgi:lipoprotein-anchoring transpeptidase ErfK/SrfK
MRRSIVFAVLAALPLAGCYQGVPDPALSSRDTEWLKASPEGEIHPIDRRYLVDDRTGENPGTIVVETKRRELYLVLPNRKAVRYSVAVGEEAFGWTGTAQVARKAEWPDWNPPPEMKKRWPHVQYVSGGPRNPMGARALYLYEGGRDTMYRIHGTNEPETIGRAVSSGCIRMRNIDVVDLYNRVQPGTKVIVR